MVVTGFLMLDAGYHRFSDSSIEELQDRFASRTKQLDDHAEKHLNEFLDAEEIDDLWDNLPHRESREIALFYFIEDSLVCWNTQLVPLPDGTLPGLDRVQAVRMENGWYLVRSARKGARSIVIAELVAHQYRYENEFLTNEFASHLKFPYEGKLNYAFEEAPYILSDQEGNALLQVEVNEDDIDSGKLALAGWILLAGFFFLIVYFRKVCLDLGHKIGFWAGLTSFITVLTSARLFLAYGGGSLESLFLLEVFDPRYYASAYSLFPSLGHFLINSILFFLIAEFIFRAAPILGSNRNLKVWGKVIPFLLVVGLFVLGYYLIDLLIGLIQDSRIAFSVNDVFSLSKFSFAALFALALIFIGYFILIYALLRIAFRIYPGGHRFFYPLAISSLLGMGVFLLTDVDPLLAVWPPGTVLFIGFLRFQKDARLTLSRTVIMLAFFSLLSAYLLDYYTYDKEHMNRLFYAERLTLEDVPNTETRFMDMSGRLAKDRFLISSLEDASYSRTRLQRYLEDTYFKEYWDRYDIEFFLLGADEKPLGTDPFALEKDFDLLNRTIREQSVQSDFDPNIYRVLDYYKKLSYIVKLPIGDSTQEGTLICEMRSKQLPEDIGFPELLIDKNTKTIQELSEYSVARYSGKHIVTRIGEYSYSTDPKDYESFIQEDEFPRHVYTNINGYDHLIYQPGPNSLIVISSEKETWVESATTFSYLFVFFGLLMSLGAGFRALQKGRKSMKLTLTNKIRSMLVGLVLISLVVFGLASRFFVQEQYQDKNNNLISEKISSVHEELNKKLGDQDELTPDMKNYMNFILKRFSDIFFTDITLYDKQGRLLATSRHEIFNNGLLSARMNPTAFRTLSNKHSAEFIHEERIGKLPYLAAYVPFVNNEGKTLAYLSLPYFARQNPLENQISNFLVSIINIFILLLALSIIAALFVSNWVTQPLKLLQESFAGIQLGKMNKQIEYEGEDEIGSLVREYNRKVLELERAADELAKSERESAWREMARQVAHEIKNPLTPMKLSVQHFSRTFDPDNPELPDRMKRFTGMLIEQIETLTHIADEFSNFAKMPAPKNEAIDLVEIVSASLEAFSHVEEAAVSGTIEVNGTAMILGDKEQLIRVFNNLIKNAVQAMDSEREGKVVVTLSKTAEHYLVTVQDNGTGIPEELKNKIFIPNFTTKSSGMGLGLAMVKSIITQSNGRIWFETEQGKGTTFFIELPQLNE